MGVHHVQNENEKIRIKFIVNGRVVAAPRVGAPPLPRLVFLIIKSHINLTYLFYTLEWKYIAKAAVEASKKRSRESSQGRQTFADLFHYLRLMSFSFS